MNISTVFSKQLQQAEVFTQAVADRMIKAREGIMSDSDLKIFSESLLTHIGDTIVFFIREHNDECNSFQLLRAFSSEIESFQEQYKFVRMSGNIPVLRHNK